MRLFCTGRVRAASQGMGLELQQDGGCSGCAANARCGSRMLDSAARQSQLVYLPQVRQLEPDSEVRLSFPANRFIRLVLVSYLLPACLLLAGAWFGAWFGSLNGFNADAGAFSGAFLTVLVGSGLLRLYDSRGGGQTWLRRIRVDVVSGSARQI